MSSPLLQNQAVQSGAVQPALTKAARKEDGEKGRAQVGDDAHGGEEGAANGGQPGGLLGGPAPGDNKSVRQQRRGKTRSKAGKATFKAGTGAAEEAKNTRRQQAPAQTQQNEAPRNRSRYSAENSQSLVNRAMGSQASLVQASVKFDQAQRAQQQQNGNDTNPLSGAGQRRQMLENLSRMVKISLEQHTGGAAGEAYPRRETRQIFSALQGLKAGASKETGGPTTTANNTPSTRTVSNGEFALKEAKMSNIQQIFMDPPPPPEGHEPLELVA